MQDSLYFAKQTTFTKKLTNNRIISNNWTHKSFTLTVLKKILHQVLKQNKKESTNVLSFATDLQTGRTLDMIQRLQIVTSCHQNNFKEENTPKSQHNLTEAAKQ